MTPVKDLPRLLDRFYSGYNRGLTGDFRPVQNEDGSIRTHCNDFIQSVCNSFGYGDFNGMIANQIVDFMEDQKNGWFPVQERDAQFHANNGVFVIAGWKNPVGHGHVCFVLPGILEQSGSFARDVPKVVNVGKDVFFGKKASYAFTIEEMPKYYVLGGMV